MLTGLEVVTTKTTMVNHIVNGILSLTPVGPGAHGRITTGEHGVVLLDDKSFVPGLQVSFGDDHCMVPLDCLEVEK
jgi:hypothetical protein